MTLIKILLIVLVAAIAVLVLRQHGTNRGSALAKLGMVAFLLLATYAVLRPDDVTWVAGRLGVGRGADLLLYLLVVGCVYFAVTTHLRFREVERRLAVLARRIALDEAFTADRTIPQPATAPPNRSEPTAGAPRE